MNVFHVIICFLLTTTVSVAQSTDKVKSKNEVKIKSIYFGGGSYYIDGEQELTLYEWLDEFENIHQYQIRIESHTDNIGSKSYNQYLSEMRSEAARILLSKYHTELVNVSVGDFGEDVPDFDNQQWQGKLRNRRVDIILRKLEF